MMKLSIFAAGSILLFVMETGFSLALRRYDLPGQRTAFFRGPITVAFEELIRNDSEAIGPTQLVHRPIPPMTHGADSSTTTNHSQLMKVDSPF